MPDNMKPPVELLNVDLMEYEEHRQLALFFDQAVLLLEKFNWAPEVKKFFKENEIPIQRTRQKLFKHITDKGPSS